jgi:hypothetical protein
MFQPNQNNYSKKEMFVLITTIFISIIFYSQFHNQINLIKSLDNFSDNNSKNQYTETSKIKNRNLAYLNYPHTKEDFLRDYQKKTIFAGMISKLYEGTWETISFDEKSNKNFKVGSSKKGKALLKFERAIETNTNEEALAVIFKLYENDYIDNWFIAKNFAKTKNLVFSVINKTNINDTFIINSNFISNYEIGQIFSTKKSPDINCNTNINISFPTKYYLLFLSLSNGTKFVSNITSINNQTCELEIYSSCGFSLKFKGNILKNNYSKMKKKVNFYLYLLISISILSMISTTILTQNIYNNHSVLSALNMFSVSQNLIWHSYCCMSNISLAMNHPRFTIEFCIVSCFYLFNFTIFDSRLLFSYWKVQSSILTNTLFLRLKLRFYLLFYICFFASFFFLCTFFYDYFYIIILIFILWVPQILQNIIKNNKFIFPLIYIIGNTLDRIIIPLYFRGFDNFFSIKKNLLFILFIFSFIVLCIIFLYLQLFYGNRFFLAEKCQIEEFNYYRTKEELIAYKDNISSEECVICLFQIFETEKEDNNSNEVNNNNNKNINDEILKGEEVIARLNSDHLNNNLYIKANTNPDEQILKLEIKDYGKEITNKLSFKQILRIIFCKNFFSFYKLNENIYNKQYMLTPCHHVFHTECLETWFERKKECPNCRTQLG